MNQLRKLNAAAIKAHKSNEITALAIIYENYGRLKIKENDIDTGCFYLTNAYALALEAGLNRAKEIHTLLVYYGREE